MGQGEAIEALEDQRLNIVNHQLGSPIVGETGGEAPGQVQTFVGPSQQSDPAVGGDHTARKIALNGSLGEAFGRWMPQARRDTPCTTSRRGLDGHKSLYVNDLQGTSLPLQTRL